MHFFDNATFQIFYFSKTSSTYDFNNNYNDYIYQVLASSCSSSDVLIVTPSNLEKKAKEMLVIDNKYCTVDVSFKTYFLLRIIYPVELLSLRLLSRNVRYPYETPTKKPIELAVISNFHRREPDRRIEFGTFRS